MNEPSRKDRMRPLELLGLSAGFAGFAGVVVLVVTREFTLAAIFLGVTFVLTLIVLAMLALAVASDKDKPRDGSDSDNSRH